MNHEMAGMAGDEGGQGAAAGERRKKPAPYWLAIVLAIVLVVGTSAVLASMIRHMSAPVPAFPPPCGQGLHAVRAATRPPPSLLPHSAPGPAGPRPELYVVVTSKLNTKGLPYTASAAVRDSATGSLLTTVSAPPPSGYYEPFATGTADDRTFLIFDDPGFYLLRVSAAGRSASLSTVPVSLPAGISAAGAALSPDGSRLALIEQPGDSAAFQTGVRVVTLATGASRDWTGPPDGRITDISWAGSDVVAFQWQREGWSDALFRLLNVTGTGGSLLAGRVVPLPTWAADSDPLVTSDGRAVIVSQAPDQGSSAPWKVVELSAATGQVIEVLHAAVDRFRCSYPPDPYDVGCHVLSLAPAGVQFLMECYGFGRVDNGRFTPLPGFPAHPQVGYVPGAAW